MKTKVQAVSGKEARDAASNLDSQFRVASKSQLRKALCAMADSIIAMTTDSPDENTSLALSAELVRGILQKSGGVEVWSPLGKTAGGDHITSLVNTFFNQGRLSNEYTPELDRRRTKVMQTLKFPEIR